MNAMIETIQSTRLVTMSRKTTLHHTLKEHLYFLKISKFHIFIQFSLIRRILFLH